VMETSSYAAGESVSQDLRFCVVVDGDVTGSRGGRLTKLERGNWFEDDTLWDAKDGGKNVVVDDWNMSSPKSRGSRGLTGATAGTGGASLAHLSKESLLKALTQLGIESLSNDDAAVDYTRKLLLVKKVAIFRHLSQLQIDALIRSLVSQQYRQGASVIRQGEVGTSLFVIASGEVRIMIDGKSIRDLGKNAYFGERSLLFGENRSATIEVVSSTAQLWSIEKSDFLPLVSEKMQEELIHRIRLQDTNMKLKDLRSVKVIGRGAWGVVRLVQHTRSGTSYAIKSVKKTHGQVPKELARECDLLAANDHPFIMQLVKTFETAKKVYILTELITGGELHAAIRTIPTVLSRAQSQFYTGSLLLALESLHDRNIVFRDLKPENVMLDAQGYLKLIDFGIAKKLDALTSRTFTTVGTPHYMAPEAMTGKGYGTEVDIWSLGVMLFEFVVGFLPFADDLDDPSEVCRAVIRAELKFPSSFRDRGGKELIVGLLNRNPGKRLGGGIDGYDEIKRCLYFEVKPRPGVTKRENLFQKIIGRELEPPVVPNGEVYADDEDIADIVLSDMDEFASR